ncbi:aspartate dehydrogenase [Haloplanus halobius]|uniref:aspartate dehydrogenase n=1 Tax=Haloplanus halobius TaxID=2934938 RepID=UPI00200D06A0|nr:aspartate dehydrogenase [Haloplanus sp. XH21]
MVLEIGLIGCGTIGTEIAKAIDTDRVPDTKLGAVFDVNHAKMESLADSLAGTPAVVDSVSGLTAEVDLVVEAAGQTAVQNVAVDVLKANTDLMLMSVGALADAELRTAVLDAVDARSSRLYVPSGAIAGLDAVKAAALADELSSVSLTTRKPPSGLEGAPYIETNDIDLSDFDESTVVFEGPATEAAKAFPSNVNVAISLSLAGIGPDETEVTIVADPDEENNVHRIQATGSAGRIETTVRNVPSPTNPKTSYLAALSAIEKLRGITTPTSTGT